MHRRHETLTSPSPTLTHRSSWRPQYVIPGGSAGWYEREGYTFDVGSSMMFGFGDQDGSTNLLTRALAAVGKKLETIHDPVQIHYHLPDNGGAR